MALGLLNSHVIQEKNYDRFGAWDARSSVEVKEMEDMETSNFERQTNFLRFFGLETKRNCSKMEFENKNGGDSTKKLCVSSRATNNNSINGNFDFQERKRKEVENGTQCNINPNALILRECSVRIIGEKCKFCGRDFKCIKDVQVHMNKKHKMKTVVLKIGSEIVSRLPVRRKHVRKRHHRERKRKGKNIIPQSDGTSKMDEIPKEIPEEIPKETLSNDQTTINVNWEDDRNSILNNLLRDTRTDLPIEPNNNDECVMIIKEVRRMKKSNLERAIDHGTSNRQLSLSDAIYEMDRIENTRKVETVAENEKIRHVLENSWLDDLENNFNQLQRNENISSNFRPHQNISSSFHPVENIPTNNCQPCQNASNVIYYPKSHDNSSRNKFPSNTRPTSETYIRSKENPFMFFMKNSTSSGVSPYPKNHEIVYTNVNSLTKQLAIRFFTEEDQLFLNRTNYVDSVPDFIDYTECVGEYQSRIINQDKNLNDYRVENPFFQDSDEWSNMGYV